MGKHEITVFENPQTSALFDCGSNMFEAVHAALDQTPDVEAQRVIIRPHLTICDILTDLGYIFLFSLVLPHLTQLCRLTRSADYAFSRSHRRPAQRRIHLLSYISS